MMSLSSNPTPKKRSKAYRMKRMYHRCWSRKLNRMVDCFGAAQWKYFLLLEMDPKINTYCEQYPDVDEFFNGKRFRFVPSFWVLNKDGKEKLIELVSSESLIASACGTDRVPKNYERKRDWAVIRNVDYEFIIYEDKRFKDHLLFENLSQILPFVCASDNNYDLELENKVLGAVKSNEVVRISDLMRVFPQESYLDLYKSTFSLFHQGRVSADLTKERLSGALKIVVRA